MGTTNYYNTFIADSNGNLYAGGSQNDGWLIRSTPGPTSPSASPATASFLTTCISFDDRSVSPARSILIDDLFGTAA